MSARTQKVLRYWTVAATRWREEQRAAHHVERQGFKFYLPMTYEPVAGSGGDAERRTLLFPGFIFVKLKSDWQDLINTRGIARLFMAKVSTETDEVAPSRMRDDDVARLRSMEDADGFVRLLPPFDNGSQVVVDEDVGGAYSGISGIVAGTSAAGRVSVLLMLLGRESKREFSRSALRAA